MSVQAYVYSNIYNHSIEDPAIQHFISSLIILFTSVHISFPVIKNINKPTDEEKKQIKERKKIRQLLNDIFLSNDDKGEWGQNGIYRDFLMKLEKLIKNNKLTRSELELLRFNLVAIEEDRITGLIPSPTSDTGFISNTSIVILIQNKLQENNIPTTSGNQDILFDMANRLGDELLLQLERLRTKKNTKKRKMHHKSSPNTLPPCWHGSKCRHKDRLDHTSRFSHLSHSPSPKKSPSKKGGKRKSKKIYQCIRQTLKKYTSRGSPPYPAQECPYKRKKGNDGRMYVSKPNDTNGMFRWVPQ